MEFAPEVRFVGAVDRYVTPSVAAELLPTLREALSNVVRHARADRAEVELSVGERIELRVSDDGVGPDPSPDPSGHVGRGMGNMAEAGRHPADAAGRHPADAAGRHPADAAAGDGSLTVRQISAQDRAGVNSVATSCQLFLSGRSGARLVFGRGCGRRGATAQRKL